jgi:hypothetical protein
MSEKETVVQIQNPDVNPSLLSKVRAPLNAPLPMPPRPAIKLNKK